MGANPGLRFCRVHDLRDYGYGRTLLYRPGGCLSFCALLASSVCYFAAMVRFAALDAVPVWHCRHAHLVVRPSIWIVSILAVARNSVGVLRTHYCCCGEIPRAPKRRSRVDRHRRIERGITVAGGLSRSSCQQGCGYSAGLLGAFSTKLPAIVNGESLASEPGVKYFCPSTRLRPMLRHVRKNNPECARNKAVTYWERPTLPGFPAYQLPGV